MTEKQQNKQQKEKQKEKKEKESGKNSFAAKIGTAASSPFIWIIDQIGLTIYYFLINFGKFIPYSHVFWKGMLKASYKAFYLTSGGDAIAHVWRPNGQVDHKAVKWKGGGDEGEEKWITKGEEEHWSPGAKGRAVDLIGSVPVIFTSEDAHEVGSEVEARVSEAIDMGDWVVQREDAQIGIVENRTKAQTDGGQETAADGGEFQYVPISQNPGALKDVLVDIGSADRFDGKVVSLEKYYEMYQDKVGSEEMKNQEIRGRLAERDDDKYAKMALKFMLIAALIIAIAVLGPRLLGYLFNSGTGSSVGDSIGLYISMVF